MHQKDCSISISLLYLENIYSEQRLLFNGWREKYVKSRETQGDLTKKDTNKQTVNNYVFKHK